MRKAELLPGPFVAHELSIPNLYLVAFNCCLLVYVPIFLKEGLTQPLNF